MMIYYPSCNFRAIDAEADRRLRVYAREKGMKVAGCCRFDDHAVTEEAMYVCQACRENLESQGKGAVSLWTYMVEDNDTQFPDYNGLHVAIQDCGRDREHPEIHTAVRKLLERMHVQVTEIAANREKADYCGCFFCPTETYADVVKSFPDGTSLTRMGEGVYEGIMKENAASYPEMYVLTYCNSCYNGIRAGNGKPVHLAQLLMGTAAFDL